MDNSKIEIKTDNLILRSTSVDYKDDIFKELSAEITVYMIAEPAKKIDETIEFLKGAMKRNQAGTDLITVVLKKDSGEFLGNVSLNHLDQKDPVLGIWIKKSAHGHGYGKEAVAALKKWADENINYDYLRYPVDCANFPSRKISESLGGKIFAEYEKICPSGKKLNTVEYRIYPTK